MAPVVLSQVEVCGTAGTERREPSQNLARFDPHSRTASAGRARNGSTFTVGLPVLREYFASAVICDIFYSSCDILSKVRTISTRRSKVQR